MKMVTTKQAQEMLAERGVGVSYPTIAQWVREGRFEGAIREDTERGPVWRIPVESVRKFEQPKMGRPKQDASEATATLNKAFRAATEAGNGAGKKRGRRR
jgi:hypothetical protein